MSAPLGYLFPQCCLQTLVALAGLHLAGIVTDPMAAVFLTNSKLGTYRYVSTAYTGLGDGSCLFSGERVTKTRALCNSFQLNFCEAFLE